MQVKEQAGFRGEYQIEIIDTVTGFMVLFCTSEAQFQADGQIASPAGLSLYAWNTQTGG